MANYDLFYIYDEPVSYKTLKVYPARMREYLQFFTVAQLLLVDKNSIPDAKVISMSYLEYIFYAETAENYYMAFLDALLRIILKLDKENIEYGYLGEGKKRTPVFKIGEDIFNKQDFEEIRNIVIEQNLLNPPDDKIQKSLRDSMDDAQRLRQKGSGNKPAGIEDQMIAVMISTGLSLENVFDMTIRKFVKTLERVDHKLHYEIYLAASMSGFVTFKDKSAIKHWLSDLKKDDLSGLMEYGELETIISGAVENK